jgi:hypothetical protein
MFLAYTTAFHKPFIFPFSKYNVLSERLCDDGQAISDNQEKCNWIN